MPSAGPFRLPLRWHLALLVVGILVPMVFFALMVVHRLAEEGRSGARRRLSYSAQLLAERVEQELIASQRTLEALAASDSLARGNLREFDREARRALETQQPTWMAVVLLSPDGQQWVNTLYPAGAALPRARELESLQEVVRTGRPTVGSVSLTRQGRWAFAVRVPVRADASGQTQGRIRYVLTATLATEGLSRIFTADGKGESSGFTEWARSLVDGKGLIVVRSRASEKYVGTRATASFMRNTSSKQTGDYSDRSLEGVPVYIGYGHTRTAGWTTSVTITRESLDEPVARMSGASAVAALFLLLVSTVGAYFLSRGVSRDIVSVARSAEALAGGAEPELRHGSVAELAWVREALHHSAAQVRDRERERNQLLQAAEEARRQAEGSNRAKDEFLALLGHELRNPLAPILNTLAIVEARGGMRPRDLEILQRQSQHLSVLVDDLLDVSRITRGTIEMRNEPLEISVPAQAALEMVQPLMEERGHQLHWQIPPDGLRILGDRHRLTQVISNLLTNAARYTPPKGEITLRAELREGWVELTVTDNGRGLEPELLPRIWDLFIQGSRTIDRSEGGLGLGLAIVRSMVRLHGGEADAESAGPGLGSTFRIRLPAHPASPE